MAYTDAVIDAIHSRVDLAELIGRVTSLKRAGKNWKGLCPFHQEKTPSFIVSPEKQLYYCFGCQAGGNAFTFLMQTEQLTFPEAVEQLAARVGVPLETSDRPHGLQRTARQGIMATNQVALRYFQEQLQHAGGAAARAYLARRGVTEPTIQRWALGYAPEGWEGLVRYAATHGVAESQLIAAGLVIPRSEGRAGCYDRFRHRVMFPIHDAQGAVIGFGGRTLDDAQQPKYMNSPETAAFIKGKQLFGLFTAKPHIAAAGHVLLVEGYMDCLLLQQQGVGQAVAPLGVALTDDQARLLKRFTTEVVLLFDEDDAGAKATLRSLDLLLAEGLQVRIARLGRPMDPDEFVLTEGVAALQACVAQAQSLFDYKLEALRREHPRRQLEDRVQICHAMLDTIRRIPDEVLRRAYVKRLSDVLRLDEPAILATLKRPGGSSLMLGAPRRGEQAIGVDIARAAAETLLVGLLLEDPAMAEPTLTRVPPEALADARARRVAVLMRQLLEAGETVTAHLVVARSGTVDVASFVAEALQRADACESKPQAIQDCLAYLCKHALAQERGNLIERIQTAERTGRQDELRALLQELNTLTKRGDHRHESSERDAAVPQAH